MTERAYVISIHSIELYAPFSTEMIMQWVAAVEMCVSKTIVTKMMECQDACCKRHTRALLIENVPHAAGRGKIVASFARMNMSFRPHMWIYL